MKTAFTILLGILTVQTYCQTLRSFALTSKNQTVTIKYEAYDFLEFQLNKEKHFNGYSQRFIQGGVVKYSDSSVTFAPESDYLFFDCMPDSTRVIERHQKPSHYQLDIQSANIEKITFHSRNSQNWQGIGVSGIILGGIASLFVAPLISINYKSGGFNTKTYFTCAGIGLGFITISIPVTVLNKEEEYYLTQPGEGKFRTIWKIK